MQRKRIPKYGAKRRERILRRGQQCSSIAGYRRFLALYLLTGGFGVSAIHKMIAMARSSIYAVRDRYLEGGLDALEDARCNNGQRKLDDAFYQRVSVMVSGFPEQYGWCRPTWTRELLCRTMKERYGIQVSVSTMGRVLADMHARLGRPRPVVNCPWGKQRRERRLRQIKRIVQGLAKNELVFYQDEVDIHLNPKIGNDWMLRGQQKLVVTPGKNEKRYIAGALNAKSGEIVWVEGTSKNSHLFCDNIDLIMQRYPKAKKVHIILDNYIIHKSKVTERRLKKHQGRLQLHFLPPYCPKANPIERKWQDLHAEVTRNHKCATMKQLMQRVRAHLNRLGQQNPQPLRLIDLKKAA